MVKILTQELNLTRICLKKVFYNNTFNFLEFKSKKFYKKKHNSKNNFIFNNKKYKCLFEEHVSSSKVVYKVISLPKTQ